MATTKVTTRTIDMRTLVLSVEPRMYGERIPAYEFSNGRKFTKAPKTEYQNYP